MSVEAGKLSGAQKAAAFMLAIGEDYGRAIWEMLSDDEIKELSQHMSNLGSVNHAYNLMCSALHGFSSESCRKLHVVITREVIPETWLAAIRKLLAPNCAACGCASCSRLD